MAAEKTENETKLEGETISRNDDVKVTNLLSEIRTTELSKESSKVVNKNVEKDSEQMNTEGEVKDGDKVEEGKDKVKKVDTKENEVKNTDSGEKKEEDIKKVDNGDKKADEDKNGEKVDKKEEEVKTEEKGDTKVVVKTVEKSDKKVDSGETKVNGNNKSSDKSTKSEKVSPLAAFFKDWDKFTTKQKIDIERFIHEKAERMGAPSRLKPGVRTMYEKERNWLKFNAIRRRRESRRPLEGSRRLTDRDPPSRLRGGGDQRSRYGRRDDRRWRRYSPRREFPWRSPWAPAQPPVHDLLKHMHRFVQMVDKIPAPIHPDPKRLSLLPTPPAGYVSSRANGLHNIPVEDKSRAYADNTFNSSQSRWPVHQYPSNGEEPSRRYYGKEPSSQSLSKQRPSPYGGHVTPMVRNEDWTNRQRTFPQTSAVVPYQENRYTRRRQ